MHFMVWTVATEMGLAYPELRESSDRISKVIFAEEKQFARVIAVGAREWELVLKKKLVEKAQAQLNLFFGSESILPPDVAAKLRDTGIGESGEEVTILNFHLLEPLLNQELPAAVAKVIIDQSNALESKRVEVSGREAFRVYETFGLPLDFMVDAARDAGVAFDEPGFEAARAEEQARARASWKGGSQKSASPA
jgi:alanyl-tRNA synthetase